MIEQLLWGIAAINFVREEPVKPGACVEAHAEQRASAAVVDFRHADMESLLSKCDLSWSGEVMIKSDYWLKMDDAVRLWLHSPPHTKVLLHERAERVGVGRAHRDGVYVIVVNLGDKT